MKSSLTLALLVLSLAGAGCASSGTGAGLHVVANPAAHFEAYRTFSFGPPEGTPEGFQMTPRSAEVQRRLRGLVETVLAEKGYRPAPSDPGDVVVRLGAAQRPVESRDDGLRARAARPAADRCDSRSERRAVVVVSAENFRASFGNSPDACGCRRRNARGIRGSRGWYSAG